MQIADQTVVTIHYTLTDAAGTVLDSSQGPDNNEPLSYLHGSGTIVPGLEQALLGKSEGDQVKVTGADAGHARERARCLGAARLRRDVIQGRFFGRSSFILNTPDAIRHVLVDNTENYRGRRRHPGVAADAGRRPADCRRPRLEAPAPDAGAGLHAARGDDAGAAHDRGDRRAIADSDAVGRPVDLREAMQRMTLEIAGRTMFSFGMERHGAELREFVIEYGTRLASPHFLDLRCRCHGRRRGILPAPVSASAGRSS